MAQNRTSLSSLIPETYLAEMGRIVVTWSHVEASFHIMYLSMVVMRGAASGSLDNERVRNLMGLSLEKQLREFRKRLDELALEPALRDRFERTFSQLMTLRRERDHVAHSQWSPSISNDLQLSQDEAISLFKSWKNSKPFDQKAVLQSKLTDIVQRIEDLYWTLHSLELVRPR